MGSRVESPIKHGTSWGYSLHLIRGVPMCDECRAYQKDRQTAERLLDGQVGMQVPAEVIGSLLLAVTNPATREYAVAVIGPKTAAVCIDRATRHEVKRE